VGSALGGGAGEKHGRVGREGGQRVNRKKLRKKKIEENVTEQLEETEKSESGHRREFHLV